MGSRTHLAILVKDAKRELLEHQAQGSPARWVVWIESLPLGVRGPSFEAFQGAGRELEKERANHFFFSHLTGPLPFVACCPQIAMLCLGPAKLKKKERGKKSKSRSRWGQKRGLNRLLISREACHQVLGNAVAFQASRREKRKTKQKKEAGPEERGREPTLALHAVVSWEADAPIFSTAGAGHKRKWKQEERGNQREVFPKGTASPRLQGGHRYISLNWEHPMAEERVFRRKKGMEFHQCVGKLANALANAFTVGKRIGELANAFANPLANSRTRW